MLATISTRVDSEDKIKFENICEELGLNVSVAINMFIKKAVREDSIPIELTKTKKESILNKNLGMSSEEITERGKRAISNMRKRAKEKNLNFTLDEINEIINEVRKENGYVY